MRVTACVLFGGYVGLLVLAGAWGMLGARADFPVLLHLPLDEVPRQAAANLLSQYRFLRAMELGFGVYALVFRREIFTRAPHNRLFLFVMTAGVVARLVSLGLDGRPTGVMFVFLTWEAVGVVVIAWHTRAVRRQAAQ